MGRAIGLGAKHGQRFLAFALAAAFAASRAEAFSLEDIQLWAGAGTNRAVMVVHWSAPEVRNSTAVRNPAAQSRRQPVCGSKLRKWTYAERPSRFHG